MGNSFFKKSDHLQNEGQFTDLKALRERFDLKDFNYIDVFSEESVIKIIHKWPLFLELSRLEDEAHSSDTNDVPLQKKD